jgi:hypothetical protein
MIGVVAQKSDLPGEFIGNMPKIVSVDAGR